ncbi:MAG: quinol:cytochrome C oxidoreductase [Microscillaceae bacterium]|nr:quinol:cytochrome C oxidoreductase [Microscillaceae bacterium]
MAEGHKISLADEKTQYEFTPALKNKLIIAGGVGLAMVVVGILLWMLGIGLGGEHGGTHGESHALAGGGGEEFHWSKRLWANLWLCTVYFNGIALVGVFFVAVNYVAWAGWSALIKRVPEAFGYFLPFTGITLLALFFIAGGDLFHWTHADAVAHDPILKGKTPYLNTPFFLIRMLLYFVLWYGLFRFLRKLSLDEDKITDYKGYLKNPTIYNKMVYYSAVFVVVFAVTTSTSAWDWVMSIDAHWFSTMFGWYNFASIFVAGLATTTLAVVYLKEAGYFKLVSEHHLHDLGKFMFAFSIFWTYIWFSQFLLIYYAHIPEETIYFQPRLFGHYRGIFFLNIIINFAFPFLALMTKESKRTMSFLKIVAFAILIGHYLDFYMMIMPGTVGDHAGFGLVEFGCILIFASAFIYVFANSLSKAPLIAKNHPFIQESAHFTQFN